MYIQYTPSVNGSFNMCPSLTEIEKQEVEDPPRVRTLQNLPEPFLERLCHVVPRVVHQGVAKVVQGQPGGGVTHEEAPGARTGGAGQVQGG